MWPQHATTSRDAAKKFLKLMNEKPELWAQNVCEATEHLVAEKEQGEFLKWMADPQNKTNSKDREVKMVETSTLLFEEHPDFEITEHIPGRVPTIRVKYVPKTRTFVEDEKSPV